ncbi:hypothetical protein CK218_25650 [Mesorhizobium sp. WSM3879]|uniref:hypothetical protein n=1 Tax=Mesorhizobium sp. WSM3879 TaxID=2029406 RepID=UPI000BB080A1|nr:hypothetical protein [Mesorhizobium sp. WSM3879]PBB78179.1 hypothetical protein CK218_25650 [Mesorhizobium sp. WSM3879]
MEPDLGFVGHGTGWRKGEDALDWGEHDDEREPNGDETDGPFDGDGSGRVIAEKMLGEKAKRLPSGDIGTVSALEKPKVNPVLPLPVPLLDPDAMDLRAHYWAAKGF